MNSSMVKPEKFDHLHIVYHYIISFSREKRCETCDLRYMFFTFFGPLGVCYCTYIVEANIIVEA